MIDAGDIRLKRGIPVGQTEAVAALYWEAFGAKLGPALGPRELGIRYLRDNLNPDRVICAVEHGSVLGVLGFDEARRGAISLSFRGLLRSYPPLSAPRRAAMLAVLGRRRRPTEFQLDGISVAPQARGKGIGSQLLQCAKFEADRRGKTAVRLSVIDTNVRARALYERAGFVADRTVSIGPLSRLYGFRTAIDMVYRMTSQERA